MEGLASLLLKASQHVRYVAVYFDGKLTTVSRSDSPGASSSESDKYEELIVNPAVLTLVTQRGNIDCGGCEFVLIRYGKFFQLIRAINAGHVSICIAPEADPLALSVELLKLANDDWRIFRSSGRKSMKPRSTRSSPKLE